MDAVEGHGWGEGHEGAVGAAQAPRAVPVAGLVAKAVLWVIKVPHPATHSHYSYSKLKKKKPSYFSTVLAPNLLSS